MSRFFIGIIFLIVISIVVITIFKGVSQWNKNNNSPKLNVKARVVAKRTAVHGGGDHSTYNTYFVTFEVESGDRIELLVKANEFGMLVEGDKGELAFQGTRYHGFTRLQ